MFSICGMERPNCKSSLRGFFHVCWNEQEDAGGAEEKVDE